MKKETEEFLTKTYGTAGLSMKQGIAIDVVITIFIIASIIWGIGKVL